MGTFQIEPDKVSEIMVSTYTNSAGQPVWKYGPAVEGTQRYDALVDEQEKINARRNRPWWRLYRWLTR